MKERHYAEEQILINHKEAEAGVTVVDMCHKLSISAHGYQRAREVIVARVRRSSQGYLKELIDVKRGPGEILLCSPL